MRSMLSLWRIARGLAGPLAAALLGAVALAGCGPAVAGGTPGAGRAPLASSPSLGPAGKGLPQYAGDTLRFVKLLYRNVTSPSPQRQTPDQGVAVRVDVWEVIGADGLPTVYSARYTLPDGALAHQDYMTRTGGVTLMGAVFAPPPGAPVTPAATALASAQTFPCIYTLSPPTDRQLSVLLPLFNAGAPHGFTMTRGAPSQAPPATPALPGVTPLATLATPATVSIWTGDTITTTTIVEHNHVRIETDATGRIIYQETDTSDSQGQPLAVVWQAFGPVEVYAAASVPPATYAPPTAPQAC